MAVRSKQEQRERIVAMLPDNTTGEISAQDVRELLTDIVDSYPEAGQGGGVTPPAQPATWAQWWLESDPDPSPGEVTNDGIIGTNSVVLPDGAWSGPVRLWGLIPDDRWPLPGHPDLSGIVGGLPMELVSTGHAVSGGTGTYSLIRSGSLNPLIAETVRTVTWWPAD